MIQETVYYYAAIIKTIGLTLECGTPAVPWRLSPWARWDWRIYTTLHTQFTYSMHDVLVMLMFIIWRNWRSTRPRTISRDTEGIKGWGRGWNDQRITTPSSVVILEGSTDRWGVVLIITTVVYSSYKTRHNVSILMVEILFPQDIQYYK